jgi:predicted aconitase
MIINVHRNMQIWFSFLVNRSYFIQAGWLCVNVLSVESIVLGAMKVVPVKQYGINTLWMSELMEQAVGFVRRLMQVAVKVRISKPVKI